MRGQGRGGASRQPGLEGPRGSVEASGLRGLGRAGGLVCAGPARPPYPSMPVAVPQQAGPPGLGRQQAWLKCAVLLKRRWKINPSSVPAARRWRLLPCCGRPSSCFLLGLLCSVRSGLVWLRPLDRIESLFPSGLL